MAISRKNTKSGFVLSFFILIALLGTNAFANYSMDLVFPKRSYVNPDYNPNASPIYVEVCGSSYGQGESCGEELLNASDYEKVIYYRKFFNDKAAEFTGVTSFPDDDIRKLMIFCWMIYGGLTWLCWMEIKKSVISELDID